MLPLVSICIPNLNTRPFLPQRMETILAQSITDWELIICDSYSDDGSWEFLQKFKGDPRIRLFQVPRAGIYAGWNECLRRTNGHYVYFATSDDTMSPDCLERLVSPLHANPNTHIAVCDFQEIDAQSRPLDRGLRPQHQFLGEWMNCPHFRSGVTEFLLHAAFGTTVWVTMTSVLFRRRILSRTGFFRTDLGSRADEEWTLRASLVSDIVFVPGKLATWRIHPSQASQPLPEAPVIILRCLNSVLQDKYAGIPPAWREIPHWRDELRYTIRAAIRWSLGVRNLYRWDAKHHPLRFMHNCALMFRHDHHRFFKQMTRGFGPFEEYTHTPIQQAEHLIRLFRAPWPPQPIALTRGIAT